MLKLLLELINIITKLLKFWSNLLIKLNSLSSNY
jgi:hypothetical protein